LLPERFAVALARDNEELLPATRKVESALLGAAMTVGQMPKEPPRPEDFSSEAHRFTWAAIQAIAADPKYDYPCLTLVSYELAKAGNLERAGGPAFLAAHLDSTDCSDLDVYARIVKEAARMRRLGRLRA
jgi:replicative DNA helicase